MTSSHPIRFGSVEMTKSHVIVDRADPLSLLPLGVLWQTRADTWASADHLYLGNTRDGREVIYRIVGWQAKERALIVRRVCCSMHNVHCEPPSELCCRWCAEVDHPDHDDPSTCVLVWDGGGMPSEYVDPLTTDQLRVSTYLHGGGSGDAGMQITAEASALRAANGTATVRLPGPVAEQWLHGALSGLRVARRQAEAEPWGPDDEGDHLEVAAPDGGDRGGA